MIMLVISVILDCLDGSVARKCNKQSNFGSYLDHVLDMVQWSMFIYLYFKQKYSFILIFFILNMFALCSYIIFNIDTETHKTNNNIYNLMYDNYFIVNVIAGILLIK